MCVDFAYVNPHQPRYKTDPAGCANKYATEKKCKVRGGLVEQQGFTYVPAVSSTYGGLGEGASRAVRYVAKHKAARFNCSPAATAKSLRDKLAVSAARHLAVAIVRRRPADIPDTVPFIFPDDSRDWSDAEESDEELEQEVPSLDSSLRNAASASIPPPLPSPALAPAPSLSPSLPSQAALSGPVVHQAISVVSPASSFLNQAADHGESEVATVAS